MQHFLKTTLAIGAFALSFGMAQAQDLAPLKSDSEPDGRHQDRWRVQDADQ